MSALTDPASFPLTGRFIALELLNEGHVAELTRAGDDGRIWKHTSFGRNPESYFAEAFAARDDRSMVPFAVRLLSENRLVGMTRFLDIDEKQHRCEIGYTWTVPDVWGTAVNPEAKLLLLGHCFERAHLRRVQLKTDSLNVHSQAAIAKLGAVREGVLRAHMARPDGSQRDTVMFSVTQAEWPAVRAGLEDRLTAFCASRRFD